MTYGINKLKGRTLSVQASLSSLVLGDLVHGVLLAGLALAVALLGLGNVNLWPIEKI